METIVSPKEVKANKTHKCNYCLQQIEKGSLYEKSTYKYENEIYTWKNHKYCSEIATKLQMYDDTDGVNDEMFIENIRVEYSKIMSENHNDIYESKDFVCPKFSEQLSFVLDFHKIRLFETFDNPTL